MSLVLNTNASGGGYVLSNESLGMYPDLANQVILSFGNLYMFNNKSINDGEYVATINGTKINFWGSSVVAPQCYTSINGTNQGLVYFGSQQCQTGTVSKRVGIPIPLVGGEIIGKKIIGAKPVSAIGNNGYVMTVSTLSESFGLLHTDGSISTIGTLSYSINSNTNIRYSVGSIKRETAGNQSLYAQPNDITGSDILETQGIVAQEGDIIVCDLTLTISSVAYGDGGYATGVFFGYNYTSEDTERNKPVQISIE